MLSSGANPGPPWRARADPARKSQLLQPPSANRAARRAHVDPADCWRGYAPRTRPHRSSRTTRWPARRVDGHLRDRAHVRLHRAGGGQARRLRAPGAADGPRRLSAFGSPKSTRSRTPCGPEALLLAKTAGQADIRGGFEPLLRHQDRQDKSCAGVLKYRELRSGEMTEGAAGSTVRG